jgi:hypothetical protein
MIIYTEIFVIVTFILQVLSVIHCLRNRRMPAWILVILLLPLVGCLVYIFTEILSKSDVQEVQAGVGTVLNPGGSIRRLEKNLHFSDTFANRVALADAYLATGKTSKAIELYESSLSGNFEENEHVMSQLIIAHFRIKQYDKIVPLGKKLYSLPQFARSRGHIYYAIALDHCDQPEAAEKEFRSLKGRFSNYEARYYYGLFLLRRYRLEDAVQVWREMVNEATHLSPRERRFHREWISLAKGELQKLKDRQAVS